jgi:hypothetical protein
MAVLGVMLAFCAAMVGSARTELIATMVEQSSKFSLYQTESMKLRVMQADVEMLHALTPNAAQLAQFENALKQVRRVAGTGDSEDVQELKAAIALSTREIAKLLSPDAEDEAHLAKIARRYEHDMREAKEDAECYEDKIHAHFSAAEWYERAQLCAEIGIVIASVALLLGSRTAWMASLVFGIACAGILAQTYVRGARALAAADRKIEEAQKRTELIEESDSEPPPPKPAGDQPAAEAP